MALAISKHIFMFPFTWESSKHSDDLRKSFANIEEIKESNWKRDILTRDDDTREDIYNEKNYFYTFTHDTVYDTGSDSHIRHFERKEPLEKDVRYVIKLLGGKAYSLKVSRLHLNFHSTGVGVMSIFADNLDYPEESQILEINQYGRRIFPPFFTDIVEHTSSAVSLSLEGLNGEYSATFDKSIEMQPNKAADFLEKMIKEASCNICNVKPSFDDRMFVMSWYRHPSPNWINTEKYNEILKNGDVFLYKYIYVDSSFMSCHNQDMRHALLKASIYPKWQERGTLFGISKHSFVMATTESCPEFMLRYFETEYQRLAEMVLVQRASIIRFSKVLKECVNQDGANFNKNHRDYIDFLNMYRYPDISAQEQGTDLYSLLCQKILLKENASYLDRKFNEFQEFMELKNQRYLNTFAAIAVPISLMASLFTFFFHDEFDKDTLPFIHNHSGMIWLIISITLTIGAYLLIRKKNR